MLDSPDHWAPPGDLATPEPVVFCAAHSTLDAPTHNDLRAAFALLQGVLDRHRLDISGPAMSCLCEASREIDVAERYMGGDPTAASGSSGTDEYVGGDHGFPAGGEW